MKKKIIGIFIGTLFIATATLPIVGSLSKVGMNPDDELDQEHFADDLCRSTICQYDDTKASIMQSFKPKLPLLTRVEVYVNKVGNPIKGKIQAIIKDEIDGDWLVYKNLFDDDIPNGWHWFEIDFDDLWVQPEKTYYLVLKPVNVLRTTVTPRQLFYWYGGSSEDGSSYPRGEAYINTGTGWEEFLWYDDKYDLYFKTYGINSPPDKPSKPSGFTSGKVGDEYIYSTTSYDPDGNVLWYWFDWGDGNNSGWKGPFFEGVKVDIRYTWSDEGNYEIKVKAKDISDAESVWSDPLSVSMPKAKIYNPMIQLLIRTIQRFPMFEKILNQIYL